MLAYKSYIEDDFAAVPQREALVAAAAATAGALVQHLHPEPWLSAHRRGLGGFQRTLGDAVGIWVIRDSYRRRRYVESATEPAAAAAAAAARARSERGHTATGLKALAAATAGANPPLSNAVHAAATQQRSWAPASLLRGVGTDYLVLCTFGRGVYGQTMCVSRARVPRCGLLNDACGCVQVLHCQEVGSARSRAVKVLRLEGQWSEAAMNEAKLKTVSPQCTRYPVVLLYFRLSCELRVADTDTFFSRRREFIVELLPTFGYPTKPTVVTPGVTFSPTGIGKEQQCKKDQPSFNNSPELPPKLQILFIRLITKKEHSFLQKSPREGEDWHRMAVVGNKCIENVDDNTSCGKRSSEVHINVTWPLGTPWNTCRQNLSFQTTVATRLQLAVNWFQH
ncbi:Protein of unknown function [Gryllus bimaculatus]|nr:Protein of unknown function [Gryllus bimaculatus]